MGSKAIAADNRIFAMRPLVERPVFTTQKARHELIASIFTEITTTAGWNDLAEQGVSYTHSTRI
jgi:hypothetical protein